MTVTERTLPKGISRIDSGSTHGFQCRIYGRRKRSRFFADRKHGGRRKALAAAKRWMDKHGDGTTGRRRFRDLPQSNNSTGYAGISRRFNRLANGSMSWFYAVSYTDLATRRARSRKFFDSSYGSQQEALEAALAFRRAWEAEADARDRADVDL